MNLKQFYNKKVKIVADNELVFLGKVNDYFYPEDNDNGKESIVVDTIEGSSIENSAVEFYAENIKTIEVIK